MTVANASLTKTLQFINLLFLINLELKYIFNFFKFYFIFYESYWDIVFPFSEKDTFLAVLGQIFKTISGTYICEPKQQSLI